MPGSLFASNGVESLSNVTQPARPVSSNPEITHKTGKRIQIPARLAYQRRVAGSWLIFPFRQISPAALPYPQQDQGHGEDGKAARLGNRDRGVGRRRHDRVVGRHEWIVGPF